MPGAIVMHTQVKWTKGVVKFIVKVVLLHREIYII
jgi:hypothetical protein